MSITDQGGTEILLYEESYALVVGAGDYRAGWPRLYHVREEVQRVARELESQGFRVVTLLDPTGDELRDAVRDFIAQYGYWKGNRLVFFFSGHGHTRGTKGFFVPVDAPDPNLDLVGFVRSAIPMDQVMTWAREIEAKHALFAFDSCFSGTLFKARALPTPTEALIRDSTSRPVRQFLTAGDAGEKVPAKSIFTPLFIRALEGKADFNNDGYVTGAEIGLYIRQTMPHYDPALTPQYGKIRDPALDEGDFVFQLTALPPLPSIPAEPPVSVVEVQRMLAAHGYDPGPVDGILGDATRAAIVRFQGDHGLAATGEPSAELVANLRAPPPRIPTPPRAEAAVGVLPTGTPRERFSYGFELMRKASYDDAEVAFKEFLAAHPNDPLAGNARYWLGETYYVRGDYTRASKTFLDSYQRDRTGPKAPDSLLKLGMSLSALGKNKEACATYGELIRALSDASATIKSKADKERQRLGCR